MADSPEDSKDAGGGQPGKMRTWWHPILANCLRLHLRDHYQLKEEELVGKKPLQIDVLLLRKREGELPDNDRHTLAGLAECLNETTLLEFKSPSDSLRAGDFQTFLAYAYLYRAQNEPLLAPERLNLLVIAPRLTRPYRDELHVLGVREYEEEPGIWALDGNIGGHQGWLLETDVLAGLGHPLLTMFSPQVLSRGHELSSLLHANGYNILVNYVLSQIQQFRREGREFAMTHAGATDEMEKVYRNLMAGIPLEDRVTSAEEMHKLLTRMSPAERMAGLSPAERVADLSPEAKEALLKQLLKEMRPDSTNERRGPDSP